MTWVYVSWIVPGRAHGVMPMECYVGITETMVRACAREQIAAQLRIHWSEVIIQETTR